MFHPASVNFNRRYKENFKQSVEIKCRECHNNITLKLSIADYRKWTREDVTIQRAFPYLNPGERDLLKFGICEECYDNMFKEK